MNEYRLPQHDDSPERAETVKSARSAYTYRMDYGEYSRTLAKRREASEHLIHEARVG